MRQPTRREFLHAAGSTALGLGAAAAARANEARPASTKPNVLLILCDQLNANALSCYGGPVPTPNIDRLAKEGVRFNQATCPTPFCSPTRATITTGMYPHAHGIVTNVGRMVRPKRPEMEGIRNDDVTTDRLLNEAGYATHFYGKWHVWQDDLTYYPDMFRPVLEYTQQMEPVFQEVRKRDRKDWMQWYNWALPVTVSPAYRAAVENAPPEFHKHGFVDFIGKMGRLDLPIEQNCDVMVADRCVERIRQLGDQPYMLTCSFNMPHDPNVVPSPYYEAFSPDEVELPSNRGVREARYENQWSRQIIANLGEVGAREFLRVYYGMVKMIDDQVGRVLDALDASGRADDTIVVFTADHGDMMGGHGMVWKSTDAFYDEVARVPMIFRCPGRFAPATSEVAAGLVDLMPTLLELTNQPTPEQAQGQSLVPYLTGKLDASSDRPFSFSERVRRDPQGSRTLSPETRGSFMIRGQGWKYNRYIQGDEYLYDLTNDPGETRNLIADPARRSIRADLSGELDAWLRRTGWPAV